MRNRESHFNKPCHRCGKLCGWIYYWNKTEVWCEDCEAKWERLQRDLRYGKEGAK